MKNLFYSLLILINFISCSQAKDKGTKENINSTFTKMEKEGVDTKKPLLYGYFFFDKDKSKLEKLRDELLKESYKLVKLEKTENNEFILHVEKTEIHSRTTLLEKQDELEKLSKKFQVTTYDGWDVGNADSSKPLISNDSFETFDNKTAVQIYEIANKFYDNETNDKAVIAFQKCIDLNYKKDTCYYKQGISYIGLNQTAIGIEKLEEALKINPEYFKACYNIGVVCYDTQNYLKSIEYYQKAEKLDPKDDRIYYGIACSQFALGQLKDAKINCQKALQLNPNNNDAKTLLNRIDKS